MAARGAQGEAHRHLPLTAGGLCQKQIGDVGAGNREHQQYDPRQCGQEHHDGVPISRGQRAGRFEAEAAILLRSRISLAKMPGDYGKLSHGPQASDAGLQAPGNHNPVVSARLVVAGVGQQLIQVAERDPELAIEDQVETAETGRRDTHHGERPAR